MSTAYGIAVGFAIVGAIALCLTLIAFSRRLSMIERQLRNATVGPNPYRAAGEGDT